MGTQLGNRIWSKYVRVTAVHCFRHPIGFLERGPIVSFTFDDFPRSALHIGGAILRSHGVRGTYYAALGLMDRAEPSSMFGRDDLELAISQGHEIGCHTYDHRNAATTSPRLFEASVERNADTFGMLFPDCPLRTHSFPFSEPRPGIKRRMQSRFACCRGGGQTYNARTADLNRLSSFFIEKCRDTPQRIYDMIDENARAHGWLIFSTHDIDPTPTPFGCTPDLFERLVCRASASGAQILTVYEAWKTLFGEC